ncbi:hypothetical protein N7475_009805 [Penicillium sp. IBT 31633x]|nr:hypothetical protein N7475_009805 [Penicillium sp. IBT 31633x]
MLSKTPALFAFVRHEERGDTESESVLARTIRRQSVRRDRLVYIRRTNRGQNEGQNALQRLESIQPSHSGGQVESNSALRLTQG